MAPIVYYGAVVNPVDLRTAQTLSRCLLAVAETGLIDWIEDDVQDSMVQQVMAKHGYIDIEVVPLRLGEFLVPGFIDTHTHAPQVPNMGRVSKPPRRTERFLTHVSGQQYELLDWLEKITFPMESKFGDPEFARRTYSSVVRRIIDSGTTTCCYFGTIHLEGTKVLANIVHSLGQRAFVGKCNMDSNSPDHYIEPTVEASISATKSLVAHIERLPTFGTERLVHPILTPRFAITCSSPLLKELGKLASADSSLRIQTHVSENPSEVTFTRSLFPQNASYTDIYASHGLLRSNTILAHAIHLTEDEISLVESSGAGISHCPTSNFHLKSGVAPIGRYLDHGIKVGLGTDVSGGYSPSIINAIQNASIASKVIAMEHRDEEQHSGSLKGFQNKQLSMETLLYLATLGGAAVCDLDKSIGSFTPGKSFDALLVSVTVSHSRVGCFDTRESFVMASDDEFSDLTDLDELEDEYNEPAKKSAKRKGKSKATEGDYRIRHSLKTPRATTYSTESLFKQIDNGDIDLDPDYQREVVWSETKQIKIIDSIFRNYYVPPVIFAVSAIEDGTETRTCIDGKQRLTSIHRFMQGLIPHRDSHTNEKYWYTDNPENQTRSKKMLPEKYKRLFDNKAVVCVEYSDLKEEDEREIFTRVQLGVALTPAEKLKVVSTPRANFVREIQEAYLNNDESPLSGGQLAWNRSRGSDFRCLAQMLQSIDGNFKQSSFSTLEKWISEPTPLEKSFTTAIENTFAVYEAVSVQEDVLQKIAPIEFIAVGLLLYKFRGSLTVSGLAKAIKSMRQELRKITNDIRNNSRLQKAILTFIEKYKVPPLSLGESCAGDAVKQTRSKPGASKTAAKKLAGTKRKADDNEEDSDDDYVPAQKAKATKPKPTPSPRKRPNVTTTTAAPILPSAVPPPSPPATASPPADDDIFRMAKERIDAARAAAKQPTAPHPTSLGLSPIVPPRIPSQHGAEGLAAALEANLMNNAASNWNPNGTYVKTELGAPPLSSGSNGSYSRQDPNAWYPKPGYGTHDRERNLSRDRRDDYDRNNGGRHSSRDYSGRRY
ncbi:hypothetical protein MIND_01018700 [Mycena indigotica]|uniref:Probable guanine deaminase n=1 Tax=Mycena indigotica TaxID=2126181 RepID=A0A8H6S9T2_9AGAR|nr:uncharacterized protein MIND_01018700 [Mycena indigotica]KAF7294810.1 hypothetical protein MIND_01018700 [Mycena indigotica]